MSTAAETRHLTPEEYLTLERASPVKHEYRDGEMIAMAGAKRKHNLIALNVASELRMQLRDRPCEVYVSDMRVQIDENGLYTYPDVVVACDEPRYLDDEEDTLLNPTVLVEILSSSTESYDRGLKFARYRQVESLREYVLITQETLHIERYTRQPGDDWLLTDLRRPEDALRLASIDCEIALRDIYAKVRLQETPR